MPAARPVSPRLGDYALLERLGVGGMAEVYLAERSVGGVAEPVALKRILPGLASDARFAAMFCDEARVCALLQHANIVRVLDYGQLDGQLFMAMEYVHGLTAARLLRLAAAAKRAIPVGVATLIAGEILSGLAYVHGARDPEGRHLGLVHRDVSPGNILLGADGAVKLTDFGIVRSEIVARRTQPGELKGKMGYMSPEQVAGAEVDARSDLFTVCIVLAELLTLRPLFSGKNELEILTRISRGDLSNLERFGAGIPARMRAVLEWGLSRERERRPTSAAQLRGALLAAAEAEGVHLDAAQLAQWLRESGWVAEARPDGGAQRSISGERVRASRAPLDSNAPTHPVHAAPKSALAADAGRGAPGSRSPSAARRVPARVALRDARGNALSDVPLAELMARAATGRLPSGVMGSVGGQPPQLARTLPAVEALLRRPAYGFPGGAAREGGAPEVIARHRGLASLPRRFETRTLLRQLLRALRQGDEVLLTVQGPSDDGQVRRIFVTEGGVEFVASTEPRELLGELLVRDGGVARADVLDCLEEALASQRRLGEVVVERGLVRASALVRLLSEQRSRRLAGMFTWGEGLLTVAPYVSPGERSGALVPAVVAVVGAARQGLDDSSLAHLMAPVRNAPIVATDWDMHPGAVQPTELGLTAPELRALNLVLDDGACAGASLRTVLEAASAERLARPREVSFAVWAGASAGLLAIPGFARPGSP